MEVQYNMEYFTPGASGFKGSTEGSSADRSHSLSLTSRNRLEITGVTDVLRFENISAEIETAMGILLIEGDELRIDSFDTAKGTVTLCGTVRSLYYYDNEPQKTGKTRGLFGKR